MKKQKRMVWIGLALVVMLLLAAGSASARATRTPIAYTMFSCAVLDPGTEWYSGDGSTVHVRGRVHKVINVSDDVRLAGPGTLVGGFDLNLVTGTGNGRGTWSVQPDDVEGTWEGTWSGHWTVTDNWSSRVVGHGSGDLAGLKIFADVYTIEIPIDPPSPCAAFGADAVSGEILDPHGE